MKILLIMVSLAFMVGCVGTTPEKMISPTPVPTATPVTFPTPLPTATPIIFPTPTLIRGPRGLLGPQGLQGEAGPRGKQGLRGERGEIGMQGKDGRIPVKIQMDCIAVPSLAIGWTFACVLTE